MSEGATSPSLSEADYLTMERAAATKHEYWLGEVFARASASWEHNQIAGNLLCTLGNLAVDAPCTVLPSDMKIHIATTRGYVYPDVSVVCGSPSFIGDRTDVIDNPAVIVEVLSDSTERFDRGDKFAGYRSLPSLRDVLLVAQDQVRVEHYVRQDGAWLLREHGPGSTLSLSGLAGELAVDDIYAKVELPPK